MSTEQCARGVAGRQEIQKRRIERKGQKMSVSRKERTIQVAKNWAIGGAMIVVYRASRSAAFHPRAVCGHFGNPALASW